MLKHPSSLDVFLKSFIFCKEEPDDARNIVNMGTSTICVKLLIQTKQNRFIYCCWFLLFVLTVVGGDCPAHLTAVFIPAV